MNRNSDNEYTERHSLLTTKHQQVQYAWNKTDVDAKAKSVERSLRPLINKMTTIGDTEIISRHKKARSLKDGNALVVSVVEALRGLTNEALEVSKDTPEMRKELEKAVNEVRVSGDKFVDSGREFVKEAKSSQKRATMVQHGRELLAAVARLLAIADMVDLRLVTVITESLRKDLIALKTVRTEQELHTIFKSYSQSLDKLMVLSSKKLKTIQDIKLREQYAGARASLKKQTMFLYNATQTLVKHPNLEAAKSLQTQITNDLESSLSTILDISTDKAPYPTSSIKPNLQQEAANLINALLMLDKEIEGLNHARYKEAKTRTSIESQLNQFNNDVRVLTSNDLINQDRKNRILDECGQLTKALQDLFSAYGNNQGADKIDKSKNGFLKLSNSLKRQIKKAVADKFSNSFFDANLPLEALVQAAKKGDQVELEKQVKAFVDHTNKLIEVSSIACSLSSNPDGIELVQTTSLQLKNLTPLVVNAARILCSTTTSRVAQQNMSVFRDAWLNSLKLLTFAVDDITTIHDFLSVSENHILEDIYTCIDALHEGNVIKFHHTASQISSRTMRICEVVRAEMDNYEACNFTSEVIGLVETLKHSVLSNFTSSVEYSKDALQAKPIRDPNENEFIDASRSLYDHIREIRHTLLLVPREDDCGDSDVDKSDDYQSEVTSSDIEEHKAEIAAADEVDESTPLSPLNVTDNITKEQREQITEQLNSFQNEKKNFDREVLKWDDQSNDIIVLAKQMCMIMMDMTDFTRGRGPLRSPSDIVSHAKKISECGTKMEKLVKNLANECPESKSKNELMNYLSTIPLFCNQLNIASKVKQAVMDLDSATSLIIASKNLMNSVISLVKESYIASTKFTSKTANKKPVVQWKMKPPEKKPLVLAASKYQDVALIRKGSVRRKMEPARALAEFQV